LRTLSPLCDIYDDDNLPTLAAAPLSLLSPRVETLYEANAVDACIRLSREQRLELDADVYRRFVSKLPPPLATQAVNVCGNDMVTRLK